MKNLTPIERLEIYRDAEKIFKNDYAAGGLYKYCGLCYPIGIVLDKIGPHTIAFPLNAPEMKKYEPKNKWKYYSCFWWSPNCRRALKRRMKILEELASGEWMNEIKK